MNSRRLVQSTHDHCNYRAGTWQRCAARLVRQGQFSKSSLVAISMLREQVPLFRGNRQAFEMKTHGMRYYVHIRSVEPAVSAGLR